MSGGNAVAKMLFAQFDKDNSGSIDAEELKGLCSVLGIDLSHDTHASLLKKLDTDGDGEISFDEFVAFWEVGFNVDTLHDDDKTAEVRASRASAQEKVANEEEQLKEAAEKAMQERIEARAEMRRKSASDHGEKERPGRRLRNIGKTAALSRSAHTSAAATTAPATEGAPAAPAAAPAPTAAPANTGAKQVAPRRRSIDQILNGGGMPESTTARTAAHAPLQRKTSQPALPDASEEEHQVCEQQPDGWHITSLQLPVAHTPLQRKTSQPALPDASEEEHQVCEQQPDGWHITSLQLPVAAVSAAVETPPPALPPPIDTGFRTMAYKKLPASCSTASSYTSARALLHEYGVDKLGEELAAAGVVADGKLVTTEAAANHFARLAAGEEQEPDMAAANAELDEALSKRFLIAWGQKFRQGADEHWDSSDPAWVGKAAFSQRHRFLTTRSMDWHWFNVITLGMAGKEALADAVAGLEAMIDCATAFAKRDPEWGNLGLFFHVYPHSSVHALVMHMIDLDATGPTWEAVRFKCIPADDVLLVLRTELQASAHQQPSTGHLDKGTRVTFNKRTSIAGKTGTVLDFDEERHVYHIRLDDGKMTERPPEDVGILDRLEVRRRGHHAWRQSIVDTSDKVDHEPEGTLFGWLEKQSGGKADRTSAGNLFQKWDMRWCVLYVADGVLMYYKDESDVSALRKPLGTVDICDSSVLYVNEEEGVFAIHTPQRVLTLRAPEAVHLGQREVDTWVETLVHAGAEQVTEAPSQSEQMEKSGMSMALAHLGGRIRGATSPTRQSVLNREAATCGFLMKHSGGKEATVLSAGNMQGKWQERFFHLRKGGNLLVYYESEQKAAAKRRALGAIHVDGSLIHRQSPADFAFAVCTENRKLSVRAKSSTDMEMWIKAIVESGGKEMTIQQAMEEEQRMKRPSILQRQMTISFSRKEAKELSNELGSIREDELELTAAYLTMRVTRKDGVFGCALSEHNRITDVTPDGAAEAAGLEMWDRVIKVDGVTLTGKVADAAQGKESILLGIERPSSDAFGAILAQEEDPKAGPFVDFTSDDPSMEHLEAVSSYYVVTRTKAGEPLGLQVGPNNELQSVTPGSPAASTKLGACSGQFVAQVEGMTLKEPLDEFMKKQPDSQLFFVVTMSHDAYE